MTELNKIDWRIILNTKNYHTIFIENGEDNLPLKTIFKNIDEIQSTKGFFLMLPSLTEYENNDKSQYLKKFPSMLKKFFDTPEMKTLLISMDVFETLIKQSSRHQIFQLLRKTNKNIVIFGTGDIQQYLPKDEEYMFSYVSSEDWLSKSNLFFHFDNIKNAVKKTHNPFKNPIESSVYLLDKTENEN